MIEQSIAVMGLVFLAGNFFISFTKLIIEICSNKNNDVYRKN